MSASTALISSAPNIPNVYNLAPFIGLVTFCTMRKCLIDSVCSEPIPWHKTLTTFYSWSSSIRNIWHKESIILRNTSRIIGFSSLLQRTMRSMQRSETTWSKSWIRYLIPAILDWNPETGSIHIFWMRSNDDAIEKSIKRMSVDTRAIALQNQHTERHRVNSFDLTFGEYERRESIAGFFRRAGDHTETDFNLIFISRTISCQHWNQLTSIWLAYLSIVIPFLWHMEW